MIKLQVVEVKVLDVRGSLVLSNPGGCSSMCASLWTTSCWTKDQISTGSETFIYTWTGFCQYMTGPVKIGYVAHKICIPFQIFKTHNF